LVPLTLCDPVGLQVDSAVNGDMMPITSTHRRGGTFVAVALACTPAPALGKNCNSGGLIFLGTNSDSSRSVWLSGTIAGSYRLDAAQGNQTVDAWSMTRRGLHVSISPVVSNGNGGTHKLYDTSDSKDCLVATQNQKGGFKFPPNISLPSPNLPGNVLPPIGNFFPDFSRP
jgi:hypothetical protein